MINLIDIERRYHHLEGDFCDITSCISLWGILRKNLRKRSTYLNTGTGTETKTAFLEWFSDYKNGPPFLSFGGFQKRSAIFLVWNEEPEKKKHFCYCF